MKADTGTEWQLVADCLKQKAAGDTDLEAYLRSRKVTEQMIPGIVAKALSVRQARKTAKSRMQEGGVITGLGLGGIDRKSVV